MAEKATAKTSDVLPKSPKDARILGSKLYFNGSMCVHGHHAPRQTSNGTCIECRLHAGRRWSLEHPEKIAEFREASKPYQREKMRQYRLKDPETLNGRTRRWRQNNPGKRRASDRDRKARRRGAEGRFTEADILAITERQKGRCACCRKKQKLTVDHITPLAKGGTNWPNNLQMLCLKCNQKKHAKDPIVFMQEMGALL